MAKAIVIISKFCYSLISNSFPSPKRAKGNYSCRVDYEFWRRDTQTAAIESTVCICDINDTQKGIWELNAKHEKKRKTQIQQMYYFGIKGFKCSNLGCFIKHPVLYRFSYHFIRNTFVLKMLQGQMSFKGQAPNDLAAFLPPQPLSQNAFKRVKPRQFITHFATREKKRKKFYVPLPFLSFLSREKTLFGSECPLGLMTGLFPR